MAVSWQQVERMMRAMESEESDSASEFWAVVETRNMQMLEERGLDHLKTSVAKNYFNWMPLGRISPKLSD